MRAAFGDCGDYAASCGAVARRARDYPICITGGDFRTAALRLQLHVAARSAPPRRRAVPPIVPSNPYFEAGQTRGLIRRGNPERAS